MKFRIAARVLVCGALLGTAAAIGAACGSASAQTTGLMQLFEVDTVNPQGTIIVTGAINDYGTDSPAPGGNINLSEIVLKGGSFEADTTKISPTTSPIIDPRTCIGQFNGGGPVTLSDGTGTYAGISGSINVSSKSTVVLPKMADGTCNTTAPATAWVAEVSYVTGSGTVSYGA